jgi:hypothetical protein
MGRQRLIECVMKASDLCGAAAFYEGLSKYPFHPRFRGEVTSEAAIFRPMLSGRFLWDERRTHID